LTASQRGGAREMSETSSGKLHDAPMISQGYLAVLWNSASFMWTSEGVPWWE
jgi:hypothetical protein